MRKIISCLLCAVLLCACSPSIKPIEVDLATNEEMEIGVDPLTYIKPKEENIEVSYIIKNDDGEEVNIESLEQGDYTIIYTLTSKDDEKRTSTVEKTVKMQDTTAPVIEGIDDVLAIAVNGDVDFSKVLITDNSDKDVKYVANLENYNPKKAGEYTIILTAEDKYGNKVEKKITVNVVDEEKLEEAKTEAKKKAEQVKKEQTKPTPTPEISFEEVKATPTPKPTEKPSTGGNTGGNEVKPTATPKPTESTKPTATPKPAETAKPTPTPTAKPTATPKPTPTPTPKPDACSSAESPSIWVSGGTINVGGSANTAARGFDGIDKQLGDGDISRSGSVNTGSAGTYTITYSYTNKCGKTGTASATWVVKAVEEVKPEPPKPPVLACQNGGWQDAGSWSCSCPEGFYGNVCENAVQYACPNGWDKNQPCDALVHGSPKYGDEASCRADKDANGDSNPCVPMTNNGGAVIGYN